MLNINRLCCPIEKSLLMFSTPQTAVALRITLASQLCQKAVQFLCLALSSINTSIFVSHSNPMRESHACRCEKVSLAGSMGLKNPYKVNMY